MSPALRRDIMTAVPVAFHEDGALDLDGSTAIMRYVAQSGNEGAFVLGTTGEFVALSEEERGRLVDVAMEVLAPVMRVIVHVGAGSLAEVLRLIVQARAAGAREIAVLTPYYLPASDAALRAFFRAVSDASHGLDVYVYVYRKRANNFVSNELMAELAALPNFVGAKVSEESLEQLAQYRAVVPDEFVIYTGADADLLRVTDFGAQGVISGVSSVLPKPFRAGLAVAGSDDADAVAAAQRDIDDAVGAIAGDMGRMKAAYALMGIDAGTTRMAIEPPSDATIERLRAAIEAHA